jgi:hypothetical protein
VSIKQLIYEYFEEKNKKKKKRHSDKINLGPSYLTKCGREIYYNKTKTPETNPIDLHTYIKFALGDIVHEFLQDIFRKKNVWLEGEEFKKINYAGLDWVYRNDGLLCVNKEKFIIEIKSIYGSAYNDVRYKPKDNHIKQLLMYMLFENIKKGVILYIGRDNGYIIEYTLYNNQIWRSEGQVKVFISNYPEIDFKKLQKIVGKIKKKELPERDYQIALKNMGDKISIEFTKDKVKHRTPWECKLCRWKDLCWEKELKEIKNSKFYIDGKFIK